MLDPLIASLPSEPLDDLLPAIRVAQGFAYQVDQSRVIAYGEDYFQKYVGYKGGSISTAVHASRVTLCQKYGCKTLQDWGIGSGEFIEAWTAAGGAATGYDVNPVAVRWLGERGLYSPSLRGVDGVCFWDSLEHTANPSELLRKVERWAFVSLPVTDDLHGIRSWSHYRPNEHLTYWRADGLVSFAGLCGLELVETNDAEHLAGRTADIRTFVFRRRDARTA